MVNTEVTFVVLVAFLFITLCSSSMYRRSCSVLLIQLVLSGLLLSSWAVHESLNFILQPKERQCFFQEFEKDSYAHLVEVFVEAGGNLAVQMEVFGPITEVEDVKNENFGRAIVSESIDPSK